MKGITLIGMTGAGKSTIGPVLAKELGWPLHDIDDIMVEREQKLLGQVVEEKGAGYIAQLEAQCVAELNLHDSVLVTPGSIVYDEPCHAQLRDQTHVVCLDVPLAILRERFGVDPKKAGAIVGLEEGGFERLFSERQPLYEALADFVIDCSGKDPGVIAQEIIKLTAVKT